MLAWTRWLVLRERGQWLLAIAFAACLPAIKLEGAIWLALFGAVAMYELIPARWRRLVLAGGLALIVLGLGLIGTHLSVPGSGWLRFDWRSVQLAAAPPLELGWHPVGGAMLASLFTLPNWHLLWYA